LRKDDWHYESEDDEGEDVGKFNEDEAEGADAEGGEKKEGEEKKEGGAAAAGGEGAKKEGAGGDKKEAGGAPGKGDSDKKWINSKENVLNFNRPILLSLHVDFILIISCTLTFQLQFIVVCCLKYTFNLIKIFTITDFIFNTYYILTYK